MHIKINPIVLKDAINKLRHINKIPSLDIKYVVYCLKALENQLELVVSDLETISMSVIVPAEVLEPGYVNINGTEFQKVVGKLGTARGRKTDTVDLLLKDKQLFLNTKTIYEEADQEVSQTRNFSLVDFDLSEEITNLGDTEKIAVDGDVMKDIFAITASFVNATNPDSIEMTGMSLKITPDGTLSMAGCDGPRLIECRTKLETGLELNVVVPKILSSVLYSSILYEDKVTLSFSQKFIGLEIEREDFKMSAIASLIYGRYPPFEEFFTTEGYEIVADPELLLDTVGSIVDVLDSSEFKVELSIKNGLLSLRGADAATKKIANEGLRVETNSDQELSIVVNGPSLKSILNLLRMSSVRLIVRSEQDPIIILPELEERSFEVRGLISSVAA